MAITTTILQLFGDLVDWAVPGHTTQRSIGAMAYIAPSMFDRARKALADLDAELEEMTDERLSIAFLLKKKRANRLVFDVDSLEALQPFSSLVDEAMGFAASELRNFLP
jgi:Na+/phosphate symporter